jgi:hypothetical protein
MVILMGAVDGGIPFAVWHASLSRAWLANYFLKEHRRSNCHQTVTSTQKQKSLLRIK